MNIPSGLVERITPPSHFLHNRELKLVPNSDGSEHLLHMQLKNFPFFKLSWRVRVPFSMYVYVVKSSSPSLTLTAVRITSLHKIKYIFKK